VSDPNGDIVRAWTREVTGENVEVRYREDAQEAVLQVLEHTLQIKKEKHGSRNIAQGKIGNTTSIFYPDANPESSSVDGQVGRESDQTFSAMRTATGNSGNDAGAEANAGRIEASATSDQYASMFRGIFTFDTSSLPDTDSISAATFSFYPSALANGLSGEASNNSTIRLVDSGLSGTQTSIGATPTYENMLSNSTVQNSSVGDRLFH
jgi:hypothetical protein